MNNISHKINGKITKITKRVEIYFPNGGTAVKRRSTSFLKWRCLVWRASAERRKVMYF